LLRRPAHAGDAPKHGDQGQVRERAGELRAEVGLEVRQQVELAAVVGAMAAAAKRHDRAGGLEIRPTGDIDAQGIRVELVSVSGGWRQSLAKTEVAGAVSLTASQPLELEFELEMPDLATPTPDGLLPRAYKGTAPPMVAPSFQAKRDSTHWFLEATVDRPKERDYRSLLELNAYNAPR
jgi:hypothetical protein